MTGNRSCGSAVIAAALVAVVGCGGSSPSGSETAGSGAAAKSTTPSAAAVKTAGLPSDACGWIPASDAERFLSAIPGSRLRVLDRCGHLPQEERPPETAAPILDFLS